MTAADGQVGRLMIATARTIEYYRYRHSDSIANSLSLIPHISIGAIVLMVGASTPEARNGIPTVERVMALLIAPEASGLRAVSRKMACLFAFIASPYLYIDDGGLRWR